jgi:hypothetical protein
MGAIIVFAGHLLTRTMFSATEERWARRSQKDHPLKIRSQRGRSIMRDDLSGWTAYRYWIGATGFAGGLVGAVTDTNSQKMGIPLWINRVGLTARRSLPIFPDQRTLLNENDRSEKCQ